MDSGNMDSGDDVMLVVAMLEIWTVEIVWMAVMLVVAMVGVEG